MTKKKATPKKVEKKGKAKVDRPPEANPMAARFDDAMSRIARAKWPPKS